jgi:dTDP-glucose 4,6-dehydratase
MRILLTGGAGFIGSHVAERLASRHPEYTVRARFRPRVYSSNNARTLHPSLARTTRRARQIVVLDKLDYCSSLKNLERAKECANVRFVKGDVRSFDLLSYVLQSERIDTVVHFAAQSHVDNSFGNSYEFTKNNIEGTHALLEACVRAQTTEIRRFLHVSTDEVYGENLMDSNTEHAALLTPTNPYAATKAGAEMLVMAYGRSYGLPYIITRGNNVYGPNQYPEKAIPKFSILAKRGEKISIHGDGDVTRSYMHVDDAGSAFDVILHRGTPAQIYNIGSREERTILSVARDVCKLLDRDPETTLEHVSDRAFNDRRYFIDCSKLLALGWRQEKSWDVGLAETVRWYSNNDLSAYWGEFSPALRPHPSASADGRRRSLEFDFTNDSDDRATPTL